MRIALTLLPLLFFSLVARTQLSQKVYPLADSKGLRPVSVSIQATNYEGRKAIQVVDTARSMSGESKYAKLADVQFHNGTIEVELAGKTVGTASETARGFVGIAFRIDEQDKAFECIYLRPANGRANDQVRRNHSSQYISYPDFPWQKLRKETPEKYEAYVDLEVGKWTKISIEVKDSVAKLYVHGAQQPTLIVSDLKLDAARKGSIGLWIGPETEAYFRNLVVTATN